MPFPLVLTVNSGPEGGGNDAGGLLQGQPLLSLEKIGDIGDDLGVGLEGTLIAVHLNVPPVGVVGGDLPVVDDGAVQQGKGVGPAPPAGSIGGIAAVAGPAIGLILHQPVELPYILRITHRLEDPHVFPAGKHIGPLDACVDPHDRPGDELVFVQLHTGQDRAEGGDEITPDQGLIGDGGDLAGGNVLRPDDLHRRAEVTLALCPTPIVVIEDVQGEKVPVFGVYSVPGETAPQAIGSLMHRLHGLYDRFPGHLCTAPINDSGDRAA